MINTDHCQICAGCDRPFMPEGRADLCLRCRERSSDHLRGAGAVAWMFAATAVLAFALVSCHGSQQFPVKPTEGKARQHEALITTNQTMLGAPAIHSAGAPSVVDEALLNRVAWVESRNNPRAVGRLGEIGAYQLRPIAIREVNRVYGTKYHIRDATKMIESREIARLYLLICESRCRVKTPANVYAKYRGAK